jgi:hypothetical protein
MQRLLGNLLRKLYNFIASPGLQMHFRIQFTGKQFNLQFSQRNLRRKEVTAHAWIILESGHLQEGERYSTINTNRCP